MIRIEFTRKIVNLLAAMFLAEEHPIIDFALRSAQEQKRLFDAGLSKCDGINNVSYHQLGRAMDIYFIEDNKMVPPKKGYAFWHDYWRNMGGHPMIEWDQGHFEG